jgi:hypothetical protein
MAGESTKNKKWELTDVEQGQVITEESRKLQID